MEHENAQTTPSTNDFAATRANAEAVLARKLASHNIGEEGNSEFLDGTVKIDTGIDQDHERDDGVHNETIRLTISSPQVEHSPNEIRTAIEDTLQNIEPIDEFVRTRSDEEETHYEKGEFTKKPVIFKKEADPEKRGQIVAEMVVPEGQASKIIEKLSALDPNAAAKQQAASPSPEQQFASVDSMQLVGIHSPHHELHQHLQMAVAPFVGQELLAHNGNEEMKPIAENLINQVEDMNTLKSDALAARGDETKINQLMNDLLAKVDAAHQTVMEGIKTGAQQANPCQAANPCQPAAAAIAQAAAPCSPHNPCAAANKCAPCKPHHPKQHMAKHVEKVAEKATELASNFKAERPSPVMAPDFIKQLGDKTSLALGA